MLHSSLCRNIKLIMSFLYRFSGNTTGIFVYDTKISKGTELVWTYGKYNFEKIIKFDRS